MVLCLSRIGEDLFLEATESKALSQTRSAFFCFNLNKNFFEKYIISEMDEDGAFRCKLSLKACLAVFKSISSVERCEAVVKKAPEAEAITFDMYCKMGVKKTYKLEECDPLKAVYSKESCYNRMQIQAQTLSICLNNFPANLEEISLILAKDTVKVRSYIDTQKGDEKDKLKTELALNPNDFDSYDFNSTREVELTFCLKEMKALLSFCEKMHAQAVNFFMEEAGKPVLLSIGMANTYEADFVIATLLGPGDESSQGTGESQPSAKSSATTLPTGSTNASHPTSKQTHSIDASSSSASSRTSSSNPNKRKANTELPSPPAKQQHIEYDEDLMEEDGPMLLWAKDLPSDSDD